MSLVKQVTRKFLVKENNTRNGCQKSLVWLFFDRNWKGQANLLPYVSRLWTHNLVPIYGQHKKDKDNLSWIRESKGWSCFYIVFLYISVVGVQLRKIWNVIPCPHLPTLHIYWISFILTKINEGEISGILS